MVQKLLENGNGTRIYRGLVLAGLIGLVAGVWDTGASVRALQAEVAEVKARIERFDERLRYLERRTAATEQVLGRP